MHSPVMMRLTQRGQLPRRTILTSPALRWEMGRGVPHRGVQQLSLPPRARRHSWGRRPLPALVSCVRVPAGGARIGRGAWLGAVGLSHDPSLPPKTWAALSLGLPLQQEEVASLFRGGA